MGFCTDHHNRSLFLVHFMTLFLILTCQGVSRLIFGLVKLSLALIFFVCSCFLMFWWSTLHACNKSLFTEFLLNKLSDRFLSVVWLFCLMVFCSVWLEKDIYFGLRVNYSCTCISCILKISPHSVVLGSWEFSEYEYFPGLFHAPLVHHFCFSGMGGLVSRKVVKLTIYW